MTVGLVVGSAVLILGAGLAEVCLVRRPTLADSLYRILMAAGCAMGAIPALSVLAGADLSEVEIRASVPGGPWIFGLDVLSAAFLLLILGAGGASALYGVPYLARDRAAHRPVGGAHAMVAMLIVALMGVVTARSAIPFLIAWEGMAVTAYFLIVFESEHALTRRAGLLYLIATHTGTLALFGLFALCGAGASNLTFRALAAHAPLLGSDVAVVLWLALAGFGFKAGIVPLHFWLPEAHAAAPSHVSALMSGVVIKMGIYGLLRVITLLAAPPAWWGWVLLGLGVSSGVLGVVWALAQHDLKRLLAYHSVENIGIILLGMGAGTLGVAYGHPAMAVLGFAGAILHTLNHSLFKSLLFLGAGSVGQATGTRDIDRLGGLAKRMPRTAAAFVIGAAAIVGLPPLNGFVSEWLVYRALLHSATVTTDARFAVLAASALALIGALALACFVKVVGTVFLGVPRDRVASDAHESGSGLTGPMLALAAGCATIGLVPALVLPAAFRVGGLLAHASGAEVVDPAFASLTVFSLALATAVLLVGLLRRPITRRRTWGIADTWNCAYAQRSARMQYTAASFAAPLLAAFSAVIRVRVRRTPQTFATHPLDPILDGVVAPVWYGLRVAAARLRPLQHGLLFLYLLYIVGAVVVLLFYLLGATPAA
jgi:hydrogenase-4 component B